MAEVNGYAIKTPWTTAGGGMGKWAFAEKAGKQFFIKEFLRPTYPLEDGPGSAATKAQKRAACELFERHHRELLRSLKGLSGDGGHLVVTRDFFRVGAKYYKVTDRVETTSLALADIAAIEPPRNKAILCLSLTHSLSILHRQGIVHGDLKPPNILPKRTTRDVFVAKLIDFDDSYRAGNPPPCDEIVGDLSYYSPELLRYVCGEGDPGILSTPSDIFALALVFCQYFTGQMPTFPGSAAGEEGRRSVAQNVLDGLSPSTALASRWPSIDRLILSMLHVEPSERPSIRDVTEALVLARDSGPDAPGGPPRVRVLGGEAAPGLSSSTAGARLKGKGVALSRGPSETSGGDEPRLKGRLLGRGVHPDDE